MEQPKKETPSAHAYYNEARKKSFLYSRVLVFVSMLLMLIGLGINIFFFNNEDAGRSTITSRASEIQQLPDLPPNCLYETQNNKQIVVCNSPLPSQKTAHKDFSLQFALPKLPEQCTYQTTNDGYSVSCTNPQQYIPDAVVSIPPECLLVSQNNQHTLECSSPTKKRINASLPDLPKGCSYNKIDTTLVIRCSATTK